MAKKYFSVFNDGTQDLHVKDDEARAALTTFVGSGTGHKGGLVPDPGSTQGNTKYLREDGTWAVPAGGGGTSSIMGPSGPNHASGLTPDTPSTAGTTKFLREDGTWQVPSYPNVGLPVGSGTVTSLANLPVTNRLIVATISANQASVSISNGVTSLTAGCELHVVVYATAAVTITLPTSNPYVLCRNDSALSLSDGDIAEINFISDGTDIYVKAANDGRILNNGSGGSGR